MPPRKTCKSLFDLSVKETARILLEGCQKMDAAWVPSKEPSPMEPYTGSPKKIIISPSRDDIDVDNDLTPSQREMKKWIGNLPDTVIEAVMSITNQNLESQLLDDKDKRIILTLINIEKMKVNDFFFGIHSLLGILKGFNITNIHFTKRMWFCLWEYQEIMKSRMVHDAVRDLLPHLPHLTCVNLAYVASDRMMYTIGKYLPSLTKLDITASVVTDKGLRYLSTACKSLGRSPYTTATMEDLNQRLRDGPEDLDLMMFRGRERLSSFISTRGLPPSPNIRRNLTSLLDSEAPIELSSELANARSTSSKLEHLVLDTCDYITEVGIRFALENFNNLKSLAYHQRRSVFEIIIKLCSEMDEEERKNKQLKLEQLEHGFTYGLIPFSSQVMQLISYCPYLTNINLFTEDGILPLFVGFVHLNTLTVELEDCLGIGFLEFLEGRGKSLKSLCVSCSTDPESAAESVAGGHQGQLFNVAVVSVGLHCPQVKKLSVSGCGLVSNAAMEKLDLTNCISTSSWLREREWYTELESLLIMSYEDTLPSMTIHSGLLRSVLNVAKDLRIISLEGNMGTFFHDDYFQRILSVNKLRELRILEICVNDQNGVPGRIPLTMRSVQRVLDSCINLLEFRISDWNISDQEFDELKEQVASNNWNLRLTRKVKTTMDNE